jgi:hypothetical protein
MGLSDTPTVDTGLGADTTMIQMNDTGLSDAVTPSVDVSPTLAKTGGASLDAGRDLGIAPKVDALDTAKDTAVDTTLAVDGGTSSPDSGTTTCGASGQACCAAPADSCQADLTCLAGASCSCAKSIFGSYIIRADGVVLQMPTTATGAQTPVLDANTAQPLTGAQRCGDRFPKVRFATIETHLVSPHLCAQTISLCPGNHSDRYQHDMEA